MGRELTTSLSAKAGATAAAGRGKGFVDLFWGLFASVRLAVFLIFAIALAAVVGTLIQQEPFIPSLLPEQYYGNLYGPFWGPFLYHLGLTRVYSSWWFVGLLVLLAVNLIVCSVQRLGPLLRTLAQPPPARSLRQLRRQRLCEEVPGAGPEVRSAARALLRRRGYRIYEDETTLYGEKGRLSRYGPYIVHIGLLILLGAALFRIVPGWYLDDHVVIGEGETVLIPGTGFAVRNEGFTALYYEDGRPRHFSTEAVVIDGGREVLRHTILVNDPLVYRGVRLHQASFQAKLGRVELQLMDPAGRRPLGAFTVDLAQPEREYALPGGRRVQLLEFYPDFALDPSGSPVSTSPDPNNPAFVFRVVEPDGRAGAAQLFLLAYPGRTLQAGEPPYTFAVTGMDREQSTILMVRRDAGIPVAFAGLGLVVTGVFVSFYSYHRRIWIRTDAGDAVLAGRAHKNEHAFRQELREIARALRPGPASEGS